MKKYTVILGLVCMLTLSGCGDATSKLYNNERQIVDQSNSFGMKTSQQMVEDHEYTGQMQLNGMDTIWKYDCDTDKQIEISYLLSVSAGKAKLVLITPDNKIKTIVESDKEVKDSELVSTTIDVKKGENRIKLVAKKAQINATLRIPEGELSKLGF